MEKRNYNFKGVVKSALLYITRAMQKGYKLYKIKAGLRELVNSFYGLNRDERYRIYVAAYEVARAAVSSTDWRRVLAYRDNYDKILRAARKTKASYELRIKRMDTRAMLQSSDCIFFVCSKHNKPAEDHKDYQGKVYVDRYWRTKVLNGSTEYKAIEKYIKKYDVKTVQEIMGEPVYLTTRPYCKHYFIYVKTSTVLASTEKEIVDSCGIHREELYSNDEYFDLRERVYDALNKAEPCNWFLHKAK